MVKICCTASTRYTYFRGVYICCQGCVESLQIRVTERGVPSAEVKLVVQDRIERKVKLINNDSLNVELNIKLARPGDTAVCCESILVGRSEQDPGSLGSPFAAGQRQGHAEGSSMVRPCIEDCGKKVKLATQGRRKRLAPSGPTVETTTLATSRSRVKRSFSIYHVGSRVSASMEPKRTVVAGPIQLAGGGRGLHLVRRMDVRHSSSQR